ncbi:MAG TPA: hypothetical protein IGS37_15720 [Synechococcales cyanobacterium M55_K2018_004]|nr:hypothetical protein [Synechococcales cyanobacterium M55_K2018_004]
MLTCLSLLLVGLVLLIFQVVISLPFDLLRSLHLPQWLLLTGIVVLFAWLISDD